MAVLYSGGRRPTGKGKPKSKHRILNQPVQKSRAPGALRGPSPRAREKANGNASFKRAAPGGALPLPAPSKGTRPSIGSVPVIPKGTGGGTLLKPPPTNGAIKPPPFSELPVPTPGTAPSTVERSAKIPTPGKSAAAPGQRKKVLGLKSAKSLVRSTSGRALAVAAKGRPLTSGRKLPLPGRKG